jgi:hypothetical protein
MVGFWSARKVVRNTSEIFKRTLFLCMQQQNATTPTGGPMMSVRLADPSSIEAHKSVRSLCEENSRVFISTILILRCDGRDF